MPKGEEVLDLISRILSEEGFAVTANVSVEGLSGYSHVFHLLARKGGHVLLIDTAQDVFSFLASLAKRIDVPGYRFLVVVKEGSIKGVLPDVVDWHPEDLKDITVVTYRELEEIQDKLRSLLRSMAPR